MEEPKDKRTKAYKQWKENQEKSSKGLGDTVAKVTKATGIEKAVKFVLGQDCGCDERKEKLNEIFPYKKPECLFEVEYNYLDIFFKQFNGIVKASDQVLLYRIYNRVFHQKKEASGCSSCVAQVVRELKNYFNYYNK